LISAKPLAQRASQQNKSSERNSNVNKSVNLSTSRRDTKGKSSADKYNSTTSGIQALLNKEIKEKIEEEDK
jgi:hypothetical protein